VGVVVVTYASAATLRDCLTALPIPSLHGVVVVDNASPDSSAEIARSIEGVQVIEQDNLGFGAGCNTGAAAMPGAELLLFLNPDAVIVPAELAELVGYLDRHPRCALTGPRLQRSGEWLTSAGDVPSVLSELRLVAPTSLARRLPDRRLPKDYAVNGPVGYVEGACFLVRAGAWRNAGRFDERFFLFFEEHDLAARLRRDGWTVDLCATARAEHCSAVSRRSMADLGRSHLLRSTVLHLLEPHPWRGYVYAALARVSLVIRSKGGLDPAVARAWSSTITAALRDGRRRRAG
jgi:GT2 family glycosyltransferase